MAIAINDLVTTSFTRLASVVFSGTGAPATPFRAYALTGTAESGEYEFLGTDSGVSVFKFAPAVNPAGFSPFGDLVDFTSYSISATQLTPIANNPLDNGVTVKGIVYGFQQFADFPGTTFALLTIAQPGGGDRFIVALVGEITLLRKNPHFP